MTRLITTAILACAITGCTKIESEPEPEQQSIFKQKTQDVGEFDPDAGREVSDSKIRADTPGLAGLQAYGPMVEKISKTTIDYHLQIFNATNGRYPEDHDEFMSEIIKKNNIQLPVLPAKHTYQYDVENHKLVVVKPIAE